MAAGDNNKRKHATQLTKYGSDIVRMYVNDDLSQAEIAYVIGVSLERKVDET